MFEMAKKPDPDERVSLAPLDPESALRALLKVDPDSDPQDEPDAAEKPEKPEKS